MAPPDADIESALRHAYQAASGLADPHHASDALEQAIAGNLGDVRLFRAAAMLYRTLGRAADRLTALQRVVALAPGDLESWHPLELACAEANELPLLQRLTDDAIAAAPDNAPARFTRATCLLRDGAFDEGWRDYEWRLKIPGSAGGHPPDNWRRWDGGAMPGRRLLVFCDQGRGDIIQFVRYLPWVAQRCDTIVVSCPGEMWPILRQFPQVTTLVEQWYQAGDCEAFVPIGSLPLLAGTRLDTIPAEVPYLHADPRRAAAWRDRLDRLLPGDYRRVGLVWAGNPSHRHDDMRSATLADWRPLADLRGIAFVALQLGPAQAQAGRFFGRAPFANVGPEIRNFDDTMAILANLDLLISVDTSVVHLASAMGRPAWLLLPSFADWRWLQHRDTSPWYPTLHLFRQAAASPGWHDVIRRVAAQLARGAS